MGARTRVVPTGPSNGYGSGQWLAQYWDAGFRTWFDIGDPRDHRAAAQEMADDYAAEQREVRR
jgi:hypothetical protein